MKNLLITIVLTMFAMPTVVLADVNLDYKTKCAACHGAGTNLNPKIARLLKVDPRRLALTTSAMNRDQMIAIIEKGKNKMPSFEKELTKEQIGALIDYISAQRKTGKVQRR